MESLKPLKITCTSTDCSNNLHCFRAKAKLRAESPAGRCRTCGKDLVNWTRVHSCDLNDAAHTIASLKLELIRHHFWHISMSEKATGYAMRKGRIKLRESARKQIGRAVGSASPFRDGIQTPRESSPRANAIHYAQHATGSCCRKCVEEWHGIVQGRDLTPTEVSYLVDLAMLYLDDRLPRLTDHPQKVRKLGVGAASASQLQQAQPSHAA
jgi:hypothetical protein